VVGPGGRLIAHPDISLVLRNTDMSRLPQFQAASNAAEGDELQEARDAQGRKVLTAHARVAPLRWLVFVELPVEEAYAPLYDSIKRSGVLLFGALCLAALAGLFLARRMVVPIQALRAGAERIGAGDLTQRISVKTGDELEALAHQFNDMAGKLEESYASLERKVEERTRELGEALEQQTATSELLQVINASPGDLKPVFDAMLAKATQLCNAEFGILWTYDGEALTIAAERGTPLPSTVFGTDPLRPGPTTGLARVLREKRTVHMHDQRDDDAYRAGEPLRVAAVDRLGMRSWLGVPLLKEGNLLGIFAIYRTQVRPFANKAIALLTSFADQAVIAIENVRLFEEVQARTRELQQALEYQTATSDVLGVISRSPNELQPVLDTIVETAGRLCDANFAYVFRLREDCRYHLVAANTQAPRLIGFLTHNPPAPGDGSLTGRVAIERRTIHVPDATTDPDYHWPEWLEISGFRTFLSVPLMRDGVVTGVIALARTLAKPFTDKQIELVTTFADQAVIAIENVRLFEEVQARTRELSEALEQQTATSEVLQVINASPGNLAPVFEAMLAKAAQLCNADLGVLWTYDGEAFRIAAERGTPRPSTIFGNEPRRPGPTTGLARIAREKRVVHILDLREDEAYAAGDPIRVAAVDQLGMRSWLGVPLLKEGKLEGAFTIYRTEVRPFSDKQIALLTSFADQAVIAINNVRLFEQVQARTAELTESLEYQTATSDVLNVISRSPSELQPVLEAIVQTAAELCSAEYAFIARAVDGNCHLAAANNLELAHVQFISRNPVPINRDSILGRVALDRRTIHVPDVLADPEFKRPDWQEVGKQRTVLGVPLIRKGALLGVIILARKEVRPFTEKQIELVTTFADQAVIAINNVGLFEEVQARTAELSETLEQQTATSEVLKVISSSLTDTQPVFDAIVQSGLKLFSGAAISIALPDGDKIRAAAVAESDPARAEAWRGVFPFPLTRDYMHGLAILERRVVDIPDVEKAPDELAVGSRNFLKSGYRAVTIMPMLRGSAAIGALSVVRVAPGPLSEKQLGTLRTFANQAVIAIENTRLLSELRARTDELARSVSELQALSDVSHAVNSTLDLETVLDTIVSKAVQLSATDAGAIYVFSNLRQKFRLRATYGMSPEMIEAISHQHIGLGESYIGVAAHRREPLQVPDLSDEPPSPMRDLVLNSGYRGLLVVPLLRSDRIVGALVVRRKAPGLFPKSTIELLKAFAAQSVLAIQNARLFSEIEQKSREIEIASKHKSQFLANMSHELRTPMNAVLGFTEMMADGLYGPLPEKALKALERVQANGKHLLGLINDVLDLSKIEAGQLTLALEDYAVSQVVQTVISGTESLAKTKGLALTAKVQEGLPLGHGDERRLTQVLLNLVGNAIKFTDHGSVEIAARAVDGFFEIAVRDTGPGIAPDDQKRIFEEFQQVDSSSTRKKGGTGLGLAISKRLIEMHGGALTVESVPGEGSTFRMTMPIRAEERREAAE
jgi:GAF domain-containing protein/HAMP domain-containing protein/anti-sigma regulatory factor (Ser/Thr protein kinase)